MIGSFRHKGLKELWETGATRKIRPDLIERTKERLSVLHAARKLNDLDLPGFACHPLSGTDPLRYAIRVSGAWRMTFEWIEPDAGRVDLEQYH